MSKKLRTSLLVLISIGLFCVPASASPLLVNKTHPLQPSEYAPPQLVEPRVPTYASLIGDPESMLTPTTARQLERLFAAADSQGIVLILSSGYRSYQQQQTLFLSALANDHHQETTAAAGFSEHQTGLAVDVATYDQFCVAQQCFMLTKAYAWLESNAHRFGFIIRYPLGTTSFTGYEYEPWHLRYVGQPAADEIYRQNTTLEEYLSPG
jgi:D-alanyl-D-alanine carboxypeptidase